MEYSILDKPEQNNRDIRVYTILGKDSIVGLYLQECIRFFYKPITDFIKDRDMKRFINANSYEFDIKNGSILSLKGNPGLNKFEFESGIYVVYTPKYFDVVSKNKLNEYMENEDYGFRYDDRKKKVKSLTLTRDEKEIE